MSRIGRNPIEIPAGVTISTEGGVVTVKGANGTLSQKIDSRHITTEINGGKLTVVCGSEVKAEKAKHGLYRSLIANMVEGVTKGFSKSVLLSAVGCRCNINGGKITMLVGYSHPVEFAIPSDLKVTSTDPKDNKITITVSGISKEAVGHFAAKLRNCRKFDPYHGYGLRYTTEPWIKKEGKTAGK